MSKSVITQNLIFAFKTTEGINIQLWERQIEINKFLVIVASSYLEWTVESVL